MLSTVDARQVLGQMVAASTHPMLDQNQLTLLLDITASKDADGVVTVWNFARAAAEGWRWKAGQASACFDLSTGDQRLSRQQVYASCADMAVRYGRLDSGSMVVLSLASVAADAEQVLVL